MKNLTVCAFTSIYDNIFKILNQKEYVLHVKPILEAMRFMHTASFKIIFSPAKCNKYYVE